MKGTIQTRPGWFVGWWWEIKTDKSYDGMNIPWVYSGYAFTKWGAIYSMKKKANKINKGHTIIEVDLT